MENPKSKEELKALQEKRDEYLPEGVESYTEEEAFDEAQKIKVLMETHPLYSKIF